MRRPGAGELIPRNRLMRIIIILYIPFGNISLLFYGNFRESALSYLPDV